MEELENPRRERLRDFFLGVVVWNKLVTETLDQKPQYTCVRVSKKTSPAVSNRHILTRFYIHSF